MKQFLLVLSVTLSLLLSAQMASTQTDEEPKEVTDAKNEAMNDGAEMAMAAVAVVNRENGYLSARAVCQD